jgi:hypothetical protein
LTGFDFSEAEKLFDEFNKDDEQDEDEFDVDAVLPENPLTRRGDVWLLGKHRLVCGDSTVQRGLYRQDERCAEN